MCECMCCLIGGCLCVGVLTLHWFSNAHVLQQFSCIGETSHEMNIEAFQTLIINYCC